MKKIYKVLLTIVGILLLYGVTALLPGRPAFMNKENNPFSKGKNEYPIIAAHRGGADLMPENTIKAFKYAIENYGVRMIETDLKLTKADSNGEKDLILLHDSTLDRTTDIYSVSNKYQLRKFSPFKPSDFTYQELELISFACSNQGKSVKPYKGKLDQEYYNEVNSLFYELKSLSGDDIEERRAILDSDKYKDYKVVNVYTLFNTFKNKYEYTDEDGNKKVAENILYSVEIKDEKERGFEAVDILFKKMDLVNENNKDIDGFNIYKNVVVGTFNDEVSNYIFEQNKIREKEGKGVLLIGSCPNEVVKFVFTTYTGVNCFTNPIFSCLQIPLEYDYKGKPFNLCNNIIYRKAQSRKISVQVWTINDEEQMRKMIEMGVDVIMTDNPDVLYKLIEKMKKENI